MFEDVDNTTTPPQQQPQQHQQHNSSNHNHNPTTTAATTTPQPPPSQQQQHSHFLPASPCIRSYVLHQPFHPLPFPELFILMLHEKPLCTLPQISSWVLLSDLSHVKHIGGTILITIMIGKKNHFLSCCFTYLSNVKFENM